MIYQLIILSLLVHVLGAKPTECVVSDPIGSNADLERYQNCQIINSDVVIQSFEDPIIMIEAWECIKGSLIFKESPNLMRMEAEKLSVVENSFTVTELTSLSLISFPALRSVKSLDWKVVPMLSNVKFADDIQDVEDLTIIDTSLTGFSGFQTTELQNLIINNNRFLETVHSSVGKIKGMLSITANAESLQVDLPSLTSVGNLSVNNVRKLEVANLTSVDKSMSLYNNYFDQLELPQLKKIGGTLSLIKNHEVSVVDFESLKEINGGLMVINNTRIEDLSFFPSLNLIYGGMELIGNMRSIDFPQLKLIRGSAKVHSTYKDFDCVEFIRTQLSLALRGGKVECGPIEPYDDPSGFTQFKDLEVKSSSGSVQSSKASTAVVIMGLVYWYSFMS